MGVGSNFRKRAKMKKIILVLIVLSLQQSFYAQSCEKITFEIRNEVDKIKNENKKEEKTVRDPHYKIRITTYGKNLIEYDRVYEKYYHFNHTYLVNNDTIKYFHEKGQSTSVSTGKVNEKASYGDLYDVEYYFTDINKGFKYEKRVHLFRGNNLQDKQIKLNELEYTITEVNNSDYNSIYKFYKVHIKNK